MTPRTDPTEPRTANGLRDAVAEILADTDHPQCRAAGPTAEANCIVEGLFHRGWHIEAARGGALHPDWCGLIGLFMGQEQYCGEPRRSRWHQPGDEAFKHEFVPLTLTPARSEGAAPRWTRFTKEVSEDAEAAMRLADMPECGNSKCRHLAVDHGEEGCLVCACTEYESVRDHLHTSCRADEQSCRCSEGAAPRAEGQPLTDEEQAEIRDWYDRLPEAVTPIYDEPRAAGLDVEKSERIGQAIYDIVRYDLLDSISEADCARLAQRLIEGVRAASRPSEADARGFTEADIRWLFHNYGFGSVPADDDTLTDDRLADFVADLNDRAAYKENG